MARWAAQSALIAYDARSVGVARAPGYYFTGDGADRDHDGYYWIRGRVDGTAKCKWRAPAAPGGRPRTYASVPRRRVLIAS